jgi:hypothetical protein
VALILDFNKQEIKGGHTAIFVSLKRRGTEKKTRRFAAKG